jgi:hypothetical protein
MLLISLLRSSQGFWEFVEYTGEAVVLIGVIMEDRAESIGEKSAINVVAMGREGEPSEEISLLSKADDERRKRAIRRATKVLLSGLLLALVGIIRANQISDERIAALNVKAGEAWQHANDLAKESDALKLEIARVNKGAEDERTARVQLEASIAPEILNGEQCNALKLVFKQFGPQNLDLETMSENRDVSFLATEFEISSRDTTWSVKIFGPRQPPPKMGQLDILEHEMFSFDRGVAITRFEGSDKKSDLACKAIDDLLTKAGIQCTYISYDPPWEEPAIAAIPKNRLPPVMIPPLPPLKLPGLTSLRLSETQYDAAYREPKKKTTIQIMIWPR